MNPSEMEELIARTEGGQLGVPLPPATQFERCGAVAAVVLPVYRELQRQAAAGQVLHVDDTGVKVLACLKKNKQLPEGERICMPRRRSWGMGYTAGFSTAGERWARAAQRT